MAAIAIAKDHFEKNQLSSQTAEIGKEERMKLASPHRDMLNQEQVERSEEPFSYKEEMEARGKPYDKGKGGGKR